MGGGIYLAIPNMASCADITESICVGGGIYLAIPDMPGCVDIAEGICVSCGVYFTIPNMPNCGDISKGIFVRGGVDIISILVISGTVHVAKRISMTGNFRDSTCAETECCS